MLYIFLAACFYAGALLLGALASRNANTAVVTTVMNIVSAIIPLTFALPVVVKQGVIQSKTGLIYALLAGGAIALFTLALNKSITVEKVTIVAPLVFGGAIFLSAVLSHFFLKERITLLEGCGLLVMTFGLSVLVYARFTGK